MFKRLTFAMMIFISVSLVFAGLTGCKKDTKKYKGEVSLAYVEWSSEVASTNVVKAVLQERLNYKVKIIPVSASAMWVSVGAGDVDGLVAGWLPTTQGHYLKKVKDKIVNLGPNLKGTKVGLVVPQYVTINSISELNSNADKFKGKIIGIDPGAGLMPKTEKLIKDYKLDKFKLVEGSGAIMTAVLADSIRKKEWIVVTGWTPHWKFSRWKLKYLKDPKNIYGGEEYISTIVRKGLKKDMPEVYSFLDRFNWSPADMQEVMVMNRKDGADPYKNAVEWINKNKAKVDKWLK